MEKKRKYQNFPISLAPAGIHHSTIKKTPAPTAPATINGFRLPQRERKLSDQVPIRGSNKASTARGRARSNPTRKGFIPMPMLRTTLPKFPIALPMSV